VNTIDVGPSQSEQEFVRRQSEAYETASLDLRGDMERGWLIQLPTADPARAAELLWLLQQAFGTPLFEFATRRVGSPDDAHIVVLEALLAISRNRSTIQIRTSPIAFFFAATLAESGRYLESKSQGAIDANSLEADTTSESPSHIDASRLALTELQALVVELRCVCFLSLAEIADVVDRTVYDVRRTLADAAHILRRAF
jgi:DNA-directed RNA polymerase specialized sigma24 family protein